jgi:hypothetical protein
MKQLVAILDAIRATQCVLGGCRGPNNAVAQLRAILCDEERSAKALQFAGSPGERDRCAQDEVSPAVH